MKVVFVITIIGLLLSGSNVNHKDEPVMEYRERMEKIVQVDAADEPYSAMVGVAAALLNRIEVLGQYSEEPQKDIIVTEAVWHAVSDAYLDWDPTYGALYYVKSETELKEVQATQIIGNILFYR